MGTGIRNPVDALVALCSTPRTMKQSLRYCLDTWDRLAGEIDFDDVLVLSILRESAPDAVALIQSHIHYLRNRWTDRGRPLDKEKKQEELAWRQDLERALPSEEFRAPVELLVEFLFGQKRQTDSPQTTNRRKRQRPICAQISFLPIRAKPSRWLRTSWAPKHTCCTGCAGDWIESLPSRLRACHSRVGNSWHR